ncbi:hypothetical protein A3B64_01385 [candidate division WWE3 bacterium RIFCSPLOWO2_01_FULL_37_24]|nr:MAG: hypothetical protein A3B64_01385 [candidate division WWE3 bacterium RIFCSPLOWO2_01_FULL_37_24]
MRALNKKYILLTFAFFAVVLMSLTAVLVITKKNNPDTPPPPPYVKKESKQRIIYNPESDLATIKEDCRERGGIFNSCGSYCEGDEICIQICAYTCEFK